MTVKPLVESFLAERGLVLSSEKTLITHIEKGFDFLGQNIRRYPHGKLFIKRARKSVVSVLAKVKQIVREYLGSTAHLLINRLNPIVRDGPTTTAMSSPSASSHDSMLRYSGCSGDGRTPVTAEKELAG